MRNAKVGRNRPGGVAKRAVEGADILLKTCGRVRCGEAVVIVCDGDTRPVADLLEQRARLITAPVSLIEMPPLDMHGQEPPAQVAEQMACAGLCLGITAKSMAHTMARRAAASQGTRYLSLPDYSLDLLSDESLRADFHRQGTIARRISDAFTAGSTVRVTSSRGTDITMEIRGRAGNCCPGYVDGPGQLGSPPDIEANVSPIEDSAEGVVIVDGSIPYPGLGLLKTFVTLAVSEGRIQDIRGDTEVVCRLTSLFESANSPRAYVLAECGVGFNDKARLTGTMLTDEGALGTMHFGFGSNSTVGGLNEVAFHLDLVFCEPSLRVDGVSLLHQGVLS